ncbi:ComEC/Rec2 family competence protein [Actinomadura viridis]|uniref:ComEC/Rec2 family competence protein n=1 Tax=Actinomadura viridis TaxID=58110 RepID=UPI00369B49FC
MTPEPRPGHDLRLVVPALATWLTAALTIGLPPSAAYTVAALATLAAATLLLRRRSSTGRRVPAAGRLLPFLGRLRGRVPGSPAHAPRRERARIRRPIRRLIQRHRPRGGTGGDRAGPWPERPGRTALAPPARLTLGVMLACVAASSTAVGLRSSALASGPVSQIARDHERAIVEAVLTADPQVGSRPGRPMILARARIEAVLLRGGRVRVRVPVLLVAGDRGWLGLLPSQRVRLNGRFAPPRRADLLAAVVFVRGPPTPLGGPSAVQRAAERVRARLRQATERLPPDQRGVLPGMVIGDTSRIDPELAEDFRAAGLAHLLVVSGANLAIIIGAVLGLCRLAGLGRLRAPPLAVLAVLAFVLVARPEPSVLRATVMGLIGLLALVTGRSRQGLPVLGAAVLVLVLLDPALARSYGFTLSVLATAGLLVLAPAWRDRLRRRMPGPLADALAVAAAAQVAVAPVLVMLSGEVGVVAIAANLLAAPAVAPATLLGALAAVVALVTLPAARLLVWPAGLAVGWITGIARTAADLPYATIPWRGGGLGAAGLIAAAAVGLLILRSRRLRLLAAAAMTGVLVAVVGLRMAAPRWPPPGWAMVACDVGQGDALVLASGRGGGVVVDTGPDPRLMDRCLERLGVRHVPLLVLTHPHADHIGGTSGAGRGRTVGLVLISPSSPGREARYTAGLATRPASAGQTWTVGDLTLSVLGPPAQTPRVSEPGEGTAANNASIVLVARSPGFSALLTGDIEPDAQRSLIPGVPRVQVLKVPHHGSPRQAPAFLAAAGPAISIISVGKENDYGHPSPATLDLLRRLGTRVHRTDHGGDIAVVRTATGLAVVTRR